VIVELNVPSYRLEQARNNGQAIGNEPTLEPGTDESASGSGLRPAPPSGSSETPITVAEN
jgi:hypothetical protein